MGRFINADVYASTGQGLVGNNMFAYCNNNPVTYIDSCGLLPIITYFVNSSSTEKEETDQNGNTTYTVAVSYSVITSDTDTGYISSYESSLSLQFSVKANGLIQVDNEQNSAGMLVVYPIGACIADEILSTVSKDYNKDALLYGRTVNGLSFEMITHYLAYFAGVKTGRSRYTEMGGIDENKKGFDRNAIAFEQPIRHPGLWIEMLF